MKRFAVLFIASICLPTLPAAPSTKRPPNVVLLLADDLGYGDLGAFGQKLIQTPNLDRLAANGTRFSQAYAGATVCAPSRCSLLTGLHNGHAAIRGNREIKPEGQEPMPGNTYTVAHLFKKAGYVTGCTGKWGLGHPGSTSTPEKTGFDFFYGYNCQLLAHNYYPDHLWRNDTKVPLDGKTYSPDLITEESLGFIRANRDRPFFLYAAFTLPHPRLQVPDLSIYAERDWPENLKTIAAMITRLDRDTGRILDLLKELGLEDNTLVFFCSDNGAVYQDNFFRHSGPLRGYKRDLYEGGIRSPSIACWPGHIAAGATSDQIWAFWDFLPTMAELTGVSAPAGLDGISILPVLLKQKGIPHPPLYYEFHERGFDQAARIGNWKAVRHGTKKPIELYDLASDLAEERDVAPQHPDIVAQFAEFFAKSRADTPVWPIEESSRREKAPGPSQTGHDS